MENIATIETATKMQIRSLPQHQLSYLKSYIINEIDESIDYEKQLKIFFEIPQSISYRIEGTCVKLSGYSDIIKDFSLPDSPGDDQFTGFYINRMSVEFWNECKNSFETLSDIQRSFLEYEIEKHYKR